MVIKKKYIRKYKRNHLYKAKNNKQKKAIKIIFTLILSILYFGLYLLKKSNTLKEPILRIFIATHKDFNNYRYNPAYIIIADDKSQLHNKYNLKVMYSNKGKLYKMKRAYDEMSKLYYIYELYKKGKMSSKYIGLNHYSRYFSFTDNIPDLESIFQNYDVILNEPFYDPIGMRSQYCRLNFCNTYDEIINIIKEIKSEYYETALKINNLKAFHCCNLFIMKKEDFFKYCEFVFDVLFEFDRRNNFKTDDDLYSYSIRHGENLYHTRLEGYLSERITNIFFL